jgi:hypothetical protein
VVEIFRVPRDSCLVHLDGDRDRQREWFCYHDEVALWTASGQEPMRQSSITPRRAR